MMTCLRFWGGTFGLAQLINYPVSGLYTVDGAIQHEIYVTRTHVALICLKMGWSYKDIEHWGFLHVVERFEQFEREGWK